jgi:hypothetical protein
MIQKDLEDTVKTPNVAEFIISGYTALRTHAGNPNENGAL